MRRVHQAATIMVAALRRSARLPDGVISPLRGISSEAPSVCLVKRGNKIALRAGEFYAQVGDLPMLIANPAAATRRLRSVISQMTELRFLHLATDGRLNEPLLTSLPSNGVEYLLVQQRGVERVTMQVHFTGLRRVDGNEGPLLHYNQKMGMIYTAGWLKLGLLTNDDNIMLIVLPKAMVR